MESASQSREPDNKERFIAIFVVLSSFFGSGAASLIDQIVWDRLLQRLIGSTLPAVSILLAGFMGGLALGSWLSTRFVGRAKNCFTVYAKLEAAIGIWGYISLFLLSPAFFGIASDFGIHAPLIESVGRVDWQKLYESGPVVGRFLACLLLMILPATAMGATFPVVARCLALILTPTQISPEGNPGRDHGNFDTLVSDAYVVNLCGATLGACLAGFVLIPDQGLSQAIVYASLISFVVALSMILMQRVAFIRKARRSVEPVEHHEDSLKKSEAEKTEQSQPGASSSISTSLAVAGATVFISGAVSMLLEVAWTRLFSLLLGNSTYSISSVFMAVLLGLAVGTVVFHTFCQRFKDFRAAAATLAVSAAIFLCVGFWLFGRVPFMLDWLAVATAGVSGAQSFSVNTCQRLLVILMIVMPPAALIGGIFPLALRALLREADSHGEQLGFLYAASASGSVLGSILAGCVLLPILSINSRSGIESTLVAAILSLTLLSALLILADKQVKVSHTRLLALAACALPPLLVAVRPAWNTAIMSSGIAALAVAPDAVLKGLQQTDLLFYREGTNTTVTVSENRARNVICLRNDGKVEAALPLVADEPAVTSDINTHVLLGQLPVLLTREKSPRLFVIGFGSGATTGAALALPQTRQLIVAEIEPAVYAAAKFFDSQNEQPLRAEYLKSGRVQAVVADGRNLLSLTREKFDAIISQPAEPWINGSADLYTSEFFTTARRALSPGGVFCQWIQLYSINPEYLGVLLRTFQSVFPTSYAFHLPRQGEIILVGLSGQKQLDLPVLSSRLASCHQMNSQLSQLFPDPPSLLSCMVGTPDSLKATAATLANLSGNSRLNTDNNLLTEYALPKEIRYGEPADRYIDLNLKAIEAPDLKLSELFAGSVLSKSEIAALASATALKLLKEPLENELFYGQSAALSAQSAVAVRAQSFADLAVMVADSPVSRLTRSIVWHCLGRAQSSEIDFVIAEGARPTSAEQYTLKAICYWQRGKRAQAEAALRQSIETDRQNYMANYLLSRLLFSENRLPEARSLLTDALSRNWRSSDGLALLGRCLLRLGEDKDAADLLAALSGVCPNCWEPRFDYGKALCNLGRADEGLKQVEMAARLSPSDPAASRFVTAYYAIHKDWPLARQNLALLQAKAPAERYTELANCAVLIGEGKIAEAGPLAARLGLKPPYRLEDVTARLQPLMH